MFLESIKLPLEFMITLITIRQLRQCGSFLRSKIDNKLFVIYIKYTDA